MSSTTISMTGQKRFYISYICEKCNKPSLSIAIAKKTGSAQSGGIPGNKRREKMEHTAHESLSSQLNIATISMKHGVENSIFHDIEIESKCLHCQFMQSWALVINKVIRISNVFNVLFNLISTISVISGLLFLLSLTLNGPINIPFLIFTIALAAIALTIHLFRNKYIDLSYENLRKYLHNIDTDKRPRVLFDENELNDKVSEITDIAQKK